MPQSRPTRKLPRVRPVLEQTPQSPRESFLCEVLHGKSYGAQWHFHPEHQITLVLKSIGYRIVGDNLAPLEPGDLVLVGGGLPHVWHQDESMDLAKAGVHAIVIRFRHDFLGTGFIQAPELESVNDLLQRASRGLQITGQTRQTVAGLILQLTEKKGLERVITLLEILRHLAASREVKPISSAEFQPKLSDEDQGRMGRVLGYLHGHLTEEISRDFLAKRASLSTGAFSRFFKTRTGKTLPEYVNEMRIGRACLRLAETDDKISDIALDCGFVNLSHFNRQFLRITAMTPVAYRREFTRSAVGS